FPDDPTHVLLFLSGDPTMRKVFLTETGLPPVEFDFLGRPVLRPDPAAHNLFVEADVTIAGAPGTLPPNFGTTLDFSPFVDATALFGRVVPNADVTFDSAGVAPPSITFAPGQTPQAAFEIGFIPEPASLLLWGAAGAVILLRARRRLTRPSGSAPPPTA